MDAEQPMQCRYLRRVMCADSACVEVAGVGNEVLVRDSKHPEVAPLRFTPEEWRAFTAGVEAGEFRF